MLGFERRRDFNDSFNTSLVGTQGELDTQQIERLRRIRQAWNFYEGYHWEDLPSQDTPEITKNYCRAFVDKFVAFELGKGFTINTLPEIESVTVTRDGKNMFDYLEHIWKDNDMPILLTEIGQAKSITGEAWVQVRYYDPEELKDPFNEYPEGRIKLTVLPNSVVFPEFDPHERGVIRRITIMYQYEKTIKTPILGRTKKEKVLYKQVWSEDEVAIIDGTEEPETYPNKYGVIPFIQIKNLVVTGRNEGRGDLEDVIPLNTEYNLKESNISEIIDYHSAPVTIVYGAKIGNLEKGANKMWGGLAKDARVENLELRSELGASNQYIKTLKTSMCEIAGIPEQVLGGSLSISNTSGVALQYMNLPLIEKTRLKRMTTETGLENLNKLIILVSLLEGLIEKPQSVGINDLVWNEVKLLDTLPKDTLLELQQIQQELSSGLESRYNAMKRLGKENIEELIAEIDEEKAKEDERELNKSARLMELKGSMTPKEEAEIEDAIVNDEVEDEPQINSGMLNSQTTLEQLRIETTGSNG